MKVTLNEFVVFFCVCLFVFPFSVNAHYFQDARYEFGKLEKADCRSSCRITFSKSYRVTPLVFVTPTIATVDPDGQKPAQLVITSVSSQDFIVRQTSAPISTQYQDLNEPIMTSISYFVVEPGVAELQGGHSIVAGYVDTNQYRGFNMSHPTQIPAGSITSSDPGHQLALFSDFGYVRNGYENSVLITQIQTNTNNRWMSAGVYESENDYAQLYLELSRYDSEIPVQHKERIAYIASRRFAGETQGVRYEFNSVELNGTIGESAPLRRQCDQRFLLSHQYTKQPALIASRQSREGHQGGWARRCFLSNQRVSFVIDEDLAINDSLRHRSHTEEDIGYFAFSDKLDINLPNELPTCDTFPSAVQGRANSGSQMDMSNGSSVVNAKLANGLRYVGFESAYFANGSHCDGMPCTNDPSLQISKDKLNDFYIVDQLPDITSQQVTLSPLSSKRLSISDSTVLLTEGDYYFDYLDISHRSTINIRGDVRIHVKRLELSNDSSFNHTGEADSLLIVGYDPSLQNTNMSEQSCPYGVCQLNLASNDKIKALIYSESTVYLSNYAEIYGSVTANRVSMSGYSKITGESRCFSEPELVMTPSTTTGLTCDGLAVTFKLVDKATRQLLNNYSGTLRVDIPNNSTGQSCWLSDSEPARCTTPFQHEFVAGQDAIVTKKLSSTSLLPVHIRGSLLQNTNVSVDAGPYQFVPYGFKVTDEHRVDGNKGQVANRPFSIKVSAVASNAANPRQCQTIEDYTGMQSLDMAYELMEPTLIGNNNTLVVHNTILPKGTDPLTGVTIPNVPFDNGVAVLNSVYSSAGQFKLRVADAKWQPPQAGLPSWSGLAGNATVNSRPFALSICHEPQDGAYQLFPSGTASGGSKLVGSGKFVDARLSALRWYPSADSDNDGVPDSGYMNQLLCLEESVTGFEVSADVYFDLHTPSSGHKGKLEMANQMSHLSNGYSPISVNFNEWGVSDQRFRWSEAGSIQMWVEKNSYLNGMSVPFIKYSIGRFYPSYFSLEKAAFTYPTGQNNFVYMNQPFNEVAFEVKALSAMTESSVITEKDEPLPTLNYGEHYSQQLKASFSLVGEHADRLSIKDSDLGNGLWQSDAVWRFNPTEEVIWSRLMVSRTQSYPDKLFNYSGILTDLDSTATEIDLKISGVDPVSFSVNTHEERMRLPQQPDVRYGRMILEDLGTQSNGRVSVPMRTEFWSGEEFVVNLDDNESHFLGNQFCRQSLWNSAGSASSAASFNGSGGVSNGETDELIAKQNATIREQVRLWLRIGTGEIGKVNPTDNDIECWSSSGNQDWLKYNWRGVGDEIPSAVITFGTYRGNDRIIYRGEPRITER
ncbi:hypothetical protein HC752_18680 [Vibrio sp. S9_S30]|uniref:DUF6701 domain-containing protein n=1 Tax=Vibrio sp. S9_S30 TaxID=2720226 RepID=UPI0016804D57|nr:DUF6701 domain-containing protein [Vibrio sp. S9_S30]MBD1558965.1 hypothetical protein [Vibrio sp. S9_S30]